jgi:DNA invertase Pin-like site-specific DNA recombinase
VRAISGAMILVPFKLGRLRRSVKALCSLLEVFEKRNVALTSVRNRSTRPQLLAAWSSPSWRR